MTKVIHTIAFRSGSTEIGLTDKSDIKSALSRLTTIPIIIVDSYADARGDQAQNLAFSTARAVAVRDFIVSLGYPPHKVLVRGRGDRDFEREAAPSSNAPARRVEVIALQ